jgi:thiol:disulfide interchange protein DsbD
MNTKLSQVGGQGYVGVFIIGLAAGVVASPCTGPVVGSAVLLIAGGQFSLLQGFAVMFSFSMGLGLLFLVIGTFSAMMLQPGAWMAHVKNSFGFIMLLAALFFLNSTGYLPESVVGFVTAVLLVAWGITLGGFTPMEPGPGWSAIALRTLAIVLLMTGFLNLGWSCYGERLEGHAAAGGEAVESIAWQSDLDAAFAQAKAEGTPVMLDFTADNCAQCRELEHKTFPDPGVIRRSRSFVSLTVDCTQIDDSEQELISRYGVPGMPRIVFTRPDGGEIPGTAIQGFVPPAAFSAAMDRALAEP